MRGTNAVLREAARPLQTFAGARGEQLQQLWSALVDGVLDSEESIDAAACLQTAEQRASTEEVFEKIMPHA